MGILAREGLDDFGAKIDSDYAKAFNLFKGAADKKSYAGMYNLAQFYQSGLAGTQDSLQAKKLFDEIMNSSAENALVFKALMYETGSGIDKNLKQAQQLYELQTKRFKDVFAERGLTRVTEKMLQKAHQEPQSTVSASSIAGPSTTQQKDVCTPSKKKKNKARNKGKAKAKIIPEAVEEHISSDSENETEIDIAGEKIKEILNNALPYDDGSIIIDIKTHDDRITKIVLKNPYDDSIVTIIPDRQRKLTSQEIKKLKKFTYDDRVKKWFDTPVDELLKHNSIETIKRHRFAKRVDEIIQLYGSKAIFFKPDGSLEKNRVLAGEIATPGNPVLPGTFEYAYYKDNAKQKILYHRFLHPHSKAIPA